MADIKSGTLGYWERLGSASRREPRPGKSGAPLNPPHDVPRVQCW